VSRNEPETSKHTIFKEVLCLYIYLKSQSLIFRSNGY
jgi:hypothetical protein